MMRMEHLSEDDDDVHLIFFVNRAPRLAQNFKRKDSSQLRLYSESSLCIEESFLTHSYKFYKFLQNDNMLSASSLRMPHENSRGIHIGTVSKAAYSLSMYRNPS